MPKEMKPKTITICPQCKGIADTTKTTSTIVIMKPCNKHKTINNLNAYTASDIKELSIFAGKYYKNAQEMYDDLRKIK